MKDPMPVEVVVAIIVVVLFLIGITNYSYHLGVMNERESRISQSY